MIALAKPFAKVRSINELRCDCHVVSNDIRATVVRSLGQPPNPTTAQARQRTFGRLLQICQQVLRIQ
jgi:hypothetical protein